MDKVILDEGEYHCEVCNGIGKFNPLLQNNYCANCNGTGKLTWLEMIFGKKELELAEQFVHAGHWVSDKKYDTGSVVYNRFYSMYVCKTSHVSDLTVEPGRGEYWETYWHRYVIDEPFDTDIKGSVNNAGS